MIIRKYTDKKMITSNTKVNQPKYVQGRLKTHKMPVTEYQTTTADSPTNRGKTI